MKSVQVNYAAGDNVKIIHGPMEGFAGKVVEVNTNKGIVIVSVSFFGRETPYELQLGDVELSKD